MKKIIAVFLYLSLSTIIGVAQIKKDIKVYDYAFQTKNKIMACGSDLKNPVLITAGYNPFISPDGKKIAFTEIKKDDRFISIIDLNTKKKNRLPLQNNNFYGPVWSPDGKYIAMNVFSGKEWFIGIMDTGYNFTPLTNDVIKGSAFSPSFSFDGKKLVTHNMDTLFILSLNGRILKQIPLRSLNQEYSISSSTCFQLSPDEKHIYFEADVDDEGIDFPEAIFEYDVEKNSAKRITPVGQCCLRLFVLNNESVLFTSYFKNSRKPVIYKINPKTGDMKLLLNNADDITSRR